MKLVYAVDKNSFSSEDHSGVVLKVHSQIKQMEKANIEVDLQEYQWLNGFPQITVEEDTDFLYFRRMDPSVNQIRKFLQLKRKSRKLKVLMEIPTYPFKGEMTEKVSLKRRINNIVGTLLLRFVVDRIVLCGQENKISTLYGIPVIHFNNGVDFESLPLHQYIDTDEIHMICVSACMPSHGYDRIIEGMKLYYSDIQSRKVFFHVVGVGVCHAAYVQKAKEYGLKDKYVFFYGKKTGSELDEIYEKCNLAVNHLAGHRVGIYYISSLKSKEYAARGIPMIMSTAIDSITENTRKYMMFVPEDETAIDIRHVIEFYDSIYPNPKIHEEIRSAFKDMCDWENAFVPIIDYLKNNSQ